MSREAVEMAVGERRHLMSIMVQNGGKQTSDHLIEFEMSSPSACGSSPANPLGKATTLNPMQGTRLVVPWSEPFSTVLATDALEETYVTFDASSGVQYAPPAVRVFCVKRPTAISDVIAGLNDGEFT
jgi:hypothetical protein